MAKGSRKKDEGFFALGETNPLIARSTNSSFGTVKPRVSEIVHKLDVSDRTGAVARAVELGLLDPDDRGHE